MTRKAIVERELKRMRTVEKYAEKRASLKAILRDVNASQEEKNEARVQLQKLPRNASPSRSVSYTHLTLPTTPYV